MRSKALLVLLTRANIHGEINRCLGGKGTELSGDGKIQHVNSKDNLPGLVPIEFDLRFNVNEELAYRTFALQSALC